MLCKFRKRTCVLLVVFLSAVLCCHLVFYSQPYAVDAFSPSVLTKNDLRTRQAQHFSNYKFSLADEVAGAGGWASFAAKPQAEKCHAFFSVIDQKWPDWEVTPLHGRVFDKNVVRKGEYLRSNFKSLRPKPKDMAEMSAEQREKLLEMYESAARQTAQTEQEMADTMTVLRMVGQCFFGGGGVPDSLRDFYERYSRKAVPFFTVPAAADVAGAWFREAPGDNVLDFYHRHMAGTGIVVSTGTKHSRDVVKLVHTLRALGNTLPIEIVYRGDLSAKAREALTAAATSSRAELLGPALSDENMLRSMFERVPMSSDALSRLAFPPQNLTFVNVRNSMRGLGTGDFGGYNNKLVALFFSSFEKVLFLDTDAVPLVSPAKLFAMPEFASGAFFFQDRSLQDYNDWVETNFFAKLMPHAHSAVDVAMGIAPVSAHTMANPLMTGRRHYQEAGLFLLDKRRHFRALLHMLPLALWGEPTRSSVWGDKELYWLAMSIAGDEEYTFNSNAAASVGVISAAEYMLYNQTRAVEVCSSHPGHISAQGELLWINSGFAYCKKNGFSRDRSRFPAARMPDKAALSHVYANPLVIRHAVIPPEPPLMRPAQGPPDSRNEDHVRAQLRRRKKDVADAPQDQISAYDPQKGWTRSAICTGYHYCAYTAIESYSRAGVLEDTGKLFSFPEEKTKMYDILGAIWASSLRATIPEQKPPEKEEKPSLWEKLTGAEKTDKDKPAAKAGPDPARDKKADFDPQSEKTPAFNPADVRERPKKIDGIEDAIGKLLSGDTPSTT